jgi:hypothetical protein
LSLWNNYYGTERTTSRLFHSRVNLQSRSGEHLRRIPGELARAMVDANSAEIAHANGKVYAIKLVETAETHATRIGEAQPLNVASYGVRFTRRVKTEAGTYWEHHPRAFER